MSDFVERCRREWRRLGVPADVVDDMASELEADLEEAGADGVSADELLGSDPREFATSRAAERGVVPSSRLRARIPPRSRVVVATAALISFAAIAAGTVLLASPAERSSAPPLPTLDSSRVPAQIWVAKTALPASVSPAVQFFPNTGTAGDSRQTVAWSLLIAGLVACALAVLYRLRAGAQVRRLTS